MDYKVFDWDLHGILKANITPAKIVAEIKNMPISSLMSTLPEGEVGLRLDVREIDEPPSSTGSASPSNVKAGDSIEQATDRESAEESVEDALKKIVAEMRPENVHVNLSKLHYGMGDKNPLDFIRFYTKQRPNGTSLSSERLSPWLTVTWPPSMQNLYR